jgi:hypothetical protein
VFALLPEVGAKLGRPAPRVHGREAWECDPIQRSSPALGPCRPACDAERGVRGRSARRTIKTY